jgi:hypothetical protein
VFSYEVLAIQSSLVHKLLDIPAAIALYLQNRKSRRLQIMRRQRERGVLVVLLQQMRLLVGEEIFMERAGFEIALTHCQGYLVLAVQAEEPMTAHRGKGQAAKAWPFFFTPVHLPRFSPLTYLYPLRMAGDTWEKAPCKASLVCQHRFVGTALS